MIFDWHSAGDAPRIEGVEIAFMKPLCTVGGEHRPLRIQPTIRRLHPVDDRYWGGTHESITAYYNYEHAVWMLWTEYERLVSLLPPWHQAPHDRPVVLLCTSSYAFERALTVWFDPEATGWWSRKPGEWRTSGISCVHPDVMAQRDYRWCEPSDIFTPKMMQDDQEHRARAGERY